MKQFQTTRDALWSERELSCPPDGEGRGDTLRASGETDQTVEGFGGCFNELGALAIERLPADRQEELFDLLFGDAGLALGYCRTSVGANDFSERWYSYDETPGDYTLEHFSIDYDRAHIRPYLRRALARRPEMRLFASPWSPPTWMKTRPVYNTGAPLCWDERTLRAYAQYLVKYIQSYAGEGVRIDALHPQNEPVARQDFPSCLMTGGEYAEFIGRYLGPAFEAAGLGTAIFLGTLNAPDPGSAAFDTAFGGYAHRVMTDPAAARYVRGIGYQWAGKQAIQQTHDSYPELTLVQTECECGDGRNSWEHARYVFDLFRHYFTNGANAFCYWNMVLTDGGESSWGWRQNSLVTVRPDGSGYTLTPEFYILRHFAERVRPGARRLRLTGHWTGCAVAFRNPGGSTLLAVQNPLPESRRVDFELAGRRIPLTLAPDSVNSFLI